MNSSREPLRDGLWGLLVGDALGVPYEFQDPAALPPPDQIEMIPPPGFARSHASVPPGTWSDDGAQALCLAASLLECGGWDPADFAARLLRWRAEGYMAPDGRVFDIGVQTARALDRLSRGIPPLEAGPDSEFDNGNGSLMRCLPVALLGPDDPAALLRTACEQSALTHRHPRAQVCCVLYTFWARNEMTRSAEPWENAVAAARGLLPAASPLRRELEEVVLPAQNAPPQGTGYVVDSLHSARAACQEADYESVVRRAIAFGRDTDTTACIAGGIAGLRHGFDGIPLRWRRQLRGQDHLARLFAAAG